MYFLSLQNMKNIHQMDLVFTAIVVVVNLKLAQSSIEESLRELHHQLDMSSMNYINEFYERKAARKKRSLEETERY